MKWIRFRIGLAVLLGALAISSHAPAAAQTLAGSTESVALSGRFSWDTGGAVQGSVSLFQQILGAPERKVGEWNLNRKGAVSASVALQIWGVYRFELHDPAGNLLQKGLIVAFPSLQAGNLHMVIAQATNQVISARFTVTMSDLITTGP